ncbi:hypothetical protein GCM10010299_60260 [Streptomyces tanashiensis]|nr:hypothetical protein GCM10010299_60260 [Streptomyces tanashiensis]
MTRAADDDTKFLPRPGDCRPSPPGNTLVSSCPPGRRAEDHRAPPVEGGRAPGSSVPVGIPRAQRRGYRGHPDTPTRPGKGRQDEPDPGRSRSIPPPRKEYLCQLPDDGWSAGSSP